MKGKERKGKEEYLYSPFWPRWYTQCAQAWITQFYLQITPCLPFLRKRSPDVTTTATEAADIQLQLTTHSSARKDERLSWPSWLTYSGWFTHISGHPSATGQAQDSESTSEERGDKKGEGEERVKAMCYSWSIGVAYDRKISASKSFRKIS